MELLLELWAFLSTNKKYYILPKDILKCLTVFFFNLEKWRAGKRLEASSSDHAAPGQKFFRPPEMKKKCVVCVHLASYREPAGR